MCLYEEELSYDYQVSSYIMIYEPQIRSFRLLFLGKL